MAISVDGPNRRITVSRSDLTLVSGTLYAMDTSAFRTELREWEMSNAGRVFPVTHTHSLESTVFGITYPRGIVLANNGYSVEFSPDEQWSVRLDGSNNDIADIEGGVLVQNQVQVIPTNSAGLQIVTQGSGVTAQDKADIIAGHFTYQYEGTETFGQYLNLTRSALLGVVIKVGNVFRFRNRANDADRFTGTTDGEGSRTDVTVNNAD